MNAPGFERSGSEEVTRRKAYSRQIEAAASKSDDLARQALLTIEVVDDSLSVCRRSMTHHIVRVCLIFLPKYHTQGIEISQGTRIRISGVIGPEYRRNIRRGRRQNRIQRGQP